MTPDTAIHSTDDLRIYLQNELLKRCKERPGYSLRAFSKALEMDSTALSRILSGSRKITRATRNRLFEKLGFSPGQEEQFGDNKIKQPTTKARQTPRQYSQLTHDTFLAMSNWYYMAILELPYLKHFKLDQKWMAKTLGITVSEVNIAIEVLQRLGLIEITPEGKWVDKNPFFSTIEPNVTSAALRANQKQILGKAIDALDNTPLSQRDQTSITFAVDSSHLDAAKARIKEFRRDMLEFMQNGSENDAVYALTIGLFPLTENTFNKE